MKQMFNDKLATFLMELRLIYGNDLQITEGMMVYVYLWNVQNMERDVSQSRDQKYGTV